MPKGEEETLLFYADQIAKRDVSVEAIERGIERMFLIPRGEINEFPPLSDILDVIRAAQENVKQRADPVFHFVQVQDEEDRFQFGVEKGFWTRESYDKGSDEWRNWPRDENNRLVIPEGWPK